MTLNEKIDQFEEILRDYEPITCPVAHHFTPGLYTREIFMPKGAWITSMIHKTEHPYFVLKGRVEVLTEDGATIIEAPFVGVTKPGTRRVLHILEDCIWCTAHPTDVVPESELKQDIENAVDKICDEIIDQRPNPLLGGFVRNNVITKEIENEN